MGTVETIAVSALTAVVTAVVTGLLTFITQERRLRADLKTQFMAEEAVKDLLSSTKWKKRSFDEIKKRVGGFADDELRKLLVRAGAVRFEGQSGQELWGLRDRNKGEV